MSVAVEAEVTASEVLAEAFVLFQNFEKDERQLLLDARRIGDMLIKAKSLCKHSEWLPRLTSIFGGSTRRAQELKQIAENWELCKDARNPTEATRIVRASKKKVSRTGIAGEILQACELVTPGLCKPQDWGKIEQNNYFVFKDGRVYTYNDEVSCSAPCDYANDIEIAVKAKPLLKLLQAAWNEFNTIELGVETLELSGAGNSAGVLMEDTIQLPLDGVEEPKRWRPLPPGFDEAVKRLTPYASTDPSEFVNTTIHFHPEWTESCDNFQVYRTQFKLGLKKPTIVPAFSVDKFVGHDLNEFSVTPNWLHFRNAAGLVMSSRRWTDEYPDYTVFINKKGCHPLTLNSSIAAAALQAMIFSSENADENQVMVQLNPGKATISGRGASGWRKISRPVEYEGPKLAFNIHPILLANITKMGVDGAVCEVGPGLLKVIGDSWIYAAVVGEVEE